MKRVVTGVIILLVVLHFFLHGDALETSRKRILHLESRLPQLNVSIEATKEITDTLHTVTEASYGESNMSFFFLSMAVILVLSSTVEKKGT